MARSVAIVGAGQIGMAVERMFGEHSFNLHLYARSEPENWNWCRARFHKHRIEDDPAPRADVVIDTIAFDEDDIARYDADRVGRLIVVSSASVYCDAQGRTLDHTAERGFPQFDGLVTEETATVAPGPETYSTRKVRMERKAIERFGNRATILRPCAIHGPRSRHPREWWFVKRMLDGRKRIPLALRGQSQFQTTFVDDIAGMALEAAAKHLGGIYNVADFGCPTVLEIGQAIAERWRHRPEFVLLEGSEGTIGRTPWSVPSPFIISSAKMEAASYYPVFNYQSNVNDAVRWLVEQNPADWRAAFPQLAAYPWDLFDYAAEDRMLASL